MSDPYRTPQQPEALTVVSERWGVTLRKRFYVRLLRRIFNLRAKFQESREWHQYQMALKRYAVELEEWKAHHRETGSCAICENDPCIVRRARPVGPVPPPVHLME